MTMRPPRFVPGIAIVLLLAACGPNAERTQSSAVAAGSRCSSLTLTASRQSPITAGDQVTFAATAAGCSKAEYRFWLTAESTGVGLVMQSWGTNQAWTWSSGGTPLGTYDVSADARAYGVASDNPDATASTSFVVAPAPSSPAPSYSKVDLTITGGVNARFNPPQPPPCTVGTATDLKVTFVNGATSVTIFLLDYQGASLYITNSTNSFVEYSDDQSKWASKPYGGIIVQWQANSVVQGTVNLDLVQVFGTTSASPARLGPTHLSGDWACTLAG